MQAYTTHDHAALVEGLSALATGTDAVRSTGDAYGNTYRWFHLDTPRHMTRAAELLAKAGARLATTTAYNLRLAEPAQEICYHFELDGVVYNVTVRLDTEWPAVPSITPLFANADWNEREMMELYAVQVEGHPNPRRLFLDETLEEGLLGEAVPLSIMMNGASTVDLWERILQDREKAECAAKESRS